MTRRSQILYIISQLPHEGIGRSTQMVYKCILLGISILVDKTLNAISNRACVVLDSEFLFPFPS